MEMNNVNASVTVQKMTTIGLKLCKSVANYAIEFSKIKIQVSKLVIPVLSTISNKVS